MYGCTHLRLYEYIYTTVHSTIVYRLVWYINLSCSYSYSYLITVIIEIQEIT